MQEKLEKPVFNSITFTSVVIRQTLLGVVNKLLKTKSLLTSPSNVLPLHLKFNYCMHILQININENGIGM